MSTANDNSTHMDDLPAGNGQTEAELLDAIMASSPIMEEAGYESLPVEEIPEVDPEESGYEEDPEVPEEAVSDDYEEEVEEYEEEVGDEDAGEEPATQDASAYALDDLDLDAVVSIKIDGEEMDISFGDLVKGYSTEQSLSKKGRELGEARKALEAERIEKLGQLDAVAQAGAQMLMGPEQAAAKQYHEIEAKIKEARESGDTFELSELKDKKEQAQESYWNARRQREGMLQKVEAEKQEAAAAEWQKQIEHFNTTIPTLIDDYSPEVATSIRDFAIDEGIDPALLDTITDPIIVKFVDDYRRLKQAQKKGAAKRKAVPAKKALPTKKPPSKAQKKATKEKSIKAKAFSENATQDDHMAFLKMRASQTLGNL